MTAPIMDSSPSPLRSVRASQLCPWSEEAPPVIPAVAVAPDGTKFRCAMCGSEHEVSEREIAFGLPDDYFALAPEERDSRGMATDDFCVLGSRCFIRAVLPIPIPAEGREYCWGLWAEVSPRAFKRYLDLYSDEKQAEEPPFAGRLANELAGYESTKGLAVSVRLTGATTRPRLTLTDLHHQLSREQQNGVTPHRLLEFLSPYLNQTDGEFAGSQGKRRRSAPRGRQLKQKTSKLRVSKAVGSSQ